MTVLSADDLRLLSDLPLNFLVPRDDKRVTADVRRMVNAARTLRDLGFATQKLYNDRPAGDPYYEIHVAITDTGVAVRDRMRNR